MSYLPDILDRFAVARQRDASSGSPEWLRSWAYQDKRARRGARYEEGLPDNFHAYAGPEDLLKWFRWFQDAQRDDYLPPERLDPLIHASVERDQKVCRQHGLPFDPDEYRDTTGRQNAQDFVLQNLYPVPARNAIHRVLDFGPGYGRQANLWMDQRPDVSLVGMDAIPLSYCLQHLYYSGLGVPLVEYVASPDDFRVGEEAGIYHLPTWRTDLLADETFDLVICVQVLQELSAPLVRFMIATFQRILKPGGALYIRDHAQWQAAHRVDLVRLLQKRGFVLEFQAHIRNGEDLHGVPRIWRKVDPAVQQSQRATLGERLTTRALDLDAMLGGRLHRLVKTFRPGKN
jgi:SAM-dependent methyltransferase